MKLHQIALAVAVMAAGSASAATITLTVSGATALNKSFEKTALDMCNPAFASTTYSTAGGAKPAVRYQCIAQAGLGIGGVNALGGDTLIINKEQGGSSQGVKPVDDGLAVTIATTTCTASTIDPVVANRTHWTGCGHTTAVPHAGVSDVEPKLVSDFSTDYNNLTNKGIVAQVFGMAVTDNIYRQLQLEQKLALGFSPSIVDVAGIAAADPTFAPAKAPNLPSSFVRGAFAGTAGDWLAVNPDIVPDDDRTPFNHPNQAIWDDATANTTEIKVCRRAKGSGTLASFEATVMAKPCATSPTYGGALTLAGSTGDGTLLNDTNKGFLGETDIFTVVENGQQEAVDTCLTQAYYQGEMAIGIMGTERQSGDTGSKIIGSDDNDGIEDKWHFVKVGQIFPSVANFVNGDLDFYWAEASLNRRTAPAGGGAAYTATETNMMNYFQKEMGSTLAIRDIPLPGLAALVSNGNTFNFGKDDVGTPLFAEQFVSRASRGGNSCQEGLQTY